MGIWAWMRRNTWLALALIFAFGLALRSARCLLVNRVDKDSVEYIAAAADFASGEYLEAFARNPRMPPLYSWLIAQGMNLGLNAETAGMAISVVSGALAVIAVFFIALALTRGRRGVALTAALVCAAHPSLVENSVEVLRDSLFLFLLSSSLAFAMCAAGASGWRMHLRWASSGFLCALACMTRSEGLEVLMAVLAWGAFAFFEGRRIGAARLFRDALVGLAFFCLAFNIVAYPAQKFFRARGSEWAVADTRVSKFIRGIVIMKRENVENIGRGGKHQPL